MLTSPRRYLSYLLSRYRSDNLKSSLSDNSSYPDFCSRAASDDEIFRTFRSASGYSEVLEHVSEKLGREYLAVLSDMPTLRSRAITICQSDVTGTPRKFYYPGFGDASPTMLRYISVAADLEKYFGSLDDLCIVEIGVGFGGQCLVMCELHRPQDYALVDLDPVLALAGRFLSTTAPQAPVSFYSATAIPQVQSDIVISNYAFSELRRDVQEVYMDRLVDASRGGYMTFNRITPRSFRAISPRHFAERVGGTILPEHPNSFPGNKVVVWGNLK